jgi:hypothetical protein
MRHKIAFKHIKAVKELLNSILDCDLDSDESANIEHFAGLKDDLSDVFYTTGQFLRQGLDPHPLLQ